MKQPCISMTFDYKALLLDHVTSWWRVSCGSVPGTATLTLLHSQIISQSMPRGQADSNGGEKNPHRHQYEELRGGGQRAYPWPSTPWELPPTADRTVGKCAVQRQLILSWVRGDSSLGNMESGPPKLELEVERRGQCKQSNTLANEETEDTRPQDRKRKTDTWKGTETGEILKPWERDRDAFP